MGTSAVATLTVSLPTGCLAVPTGLVGWWPGDGNANDIVCTNHGTLQGGASASGAGVVGSAFTFDGTNGYVQIPNCPMLRPANLTIEAWVRFSSLDSPASGNSPAGQQYLVFREGAHYDYFAGFALKKARTAKGDVFEFEVDSADGQVVKVASQTLVATGVWYHVAGARGTNYLRLHVNGQLEGQTNVTFAQSYGDYPLYFGTTAQPTWDHKLAGALDEVSFYNRALEPAEVAVIYAAGSQGKSRVQGILAQPSSQLAYWGGSASFTSAASGSMPLSYQWQKDGLALPGATTSALNLTNLQLTNAGLYTVWITSAFGNATSAPVSLNLKLADLSIALTPAPGQGLPVLTIGGLASRTYGIQVNTSPAAGTWIGLTNLIFTVPTNVWYDPAPANRATTLLPRRARAHSDTVNPGAADAAATALGRTASRNALPTPQGAPGPGCQRRHCCWTV